MDFISRFMQQVFKNIYQDIFNGTSLAHAPPSVQISQCLKLHCPHAQFYLNEGKDQMLKSHIKKFSLKDVELLWKCSNVFAIWFMQCHVYCFSTSFKGSWIIQTSHWPNLLQTKATRLVLISFYKVSFDINS